MIKVVVPNMALEVLDRAIQIHGGGGVSQDFGLAYAWAMSRTLRLPMVPTRSTQGRSHAWNSRRTLARDGARGAHCTKRT